MFGSLVARLNILWIVILSGNLAVAQSISVDTSSGVGTYTSLGMSDQGSLNSVLIDSSNNLVLGDVSVSPGLKCDVEGSVGAQYYCDLNGNNCFQASQISAPSTWTDLSPNINYSGGFVGVGTSAPAYHLDIADQQVYFGVFGSSAFLVGRASDSVLYYATTDISHSKKTYMFNDAVNGKSFVGTTENILELWAGSDELDAGEPPVILSSGRLGVSDDSPDAQMEVSMSGGVVPALMISSDRDLDGDLVIIDGNKRLGIKTTTPQAPLDINGTIRISVNGTVPSACTATLAGSLALTSSYQTCICNGSNWVSTNDGASACVW